MHNNFWFDFLDLKEKSIEKNEIKWKPIDSKLKSIESKLKSIEGKLISIEILT